MPSGFRRRGSAIRRGSRMGRRPGASVRREGECNMRKRPDLGKLSASQRVAAGIAVVALAAIILWLTGVVARAATLTAYATPLLAGGTLRLARGAIGTFRETRRPSADQQKQIAPQQHQLQIVSA